MQLAFVDTETTGLDETRHAVWEVAVIVREEGRDRERLWQLRPNLINADPEALEINRFRERFAVEQPWDAAAIVDGRPLGMLRGQAVDDIHQTLAGVTVVGSNPAFDTRFLTALLGRHGLAAPWHYRPEDAITLARGYLAAMSSVPVRDLQAARSRDVSRLLGIQPPGAGEAHTALGDARWVRDVYDAVMPRT